MEYTIVIIYQIYSGKDYGLFILSEICGLDLSMFVNTAHFYVSVLIA